MLRFVLTWPGLFGLYLLLAGETGASELIAGCVVATATGVLIARLGRIASRRFAWPPGGLGVIGASLAGVVPETTHVALVLLRAVWRQPEGEVGSAEEHAVPRANDVERDAARRALETLGQSLSPNGFVLAVEDGTLRLHRLARQ